MSQTQGVLYVHSSPSALCRHVEWAAAGALGVPVRLSWNAQPAQRDTYRAEYVWHGRTGSAAAVASALLEWPRLRFEITEEQTLNTEGQRFSYTPSLGLFRATIGPHGDIVVGEERLKRAVVDDARGVTPLAEAIDTLLGRPWDDELETFRYAEDGVRWLHQVV